MDIGVVTCERLHRKGNFETKSIRLSRMMKTFLCDFLSSTDEDTKLDSKSTGSLGMMRDGVT